MALRRFKFLAREYSEGQAKKCDEDVRRTLINLAITEIVFNHLTPQAIQLSEEQYGLFTLSSVSENNRHQVEYVRITKRACLS